VSGTFSWAPAVPGRVFQPELPNGFRHPFLRAIRPAPLDRVANLLDFLPADDTFPSPPDTFPLFRQDLLPFFHQPFPGTAALAWRKAAQGAFFERQGELRRTLRPSAVGTPPKGGKLAFPRCVTWCGTSPRPSEAIEPWAGTISENISCVLSPGNAICKKGKPTVFKDVKWRGHTCLRGQGCPRHIAPCDTLPHIVYRRVLLQR